MQFFFFIFSTMSSSSRGSFAGLDISWCQGQKDELSDLYRGLGSEWVIFRSEINVFFLPSSSDGACESGSWIADRVCV